MKGHSNNLYNDLADALAKEGGSQNDINIDSSMVHNINYLIFSPFIFIFLYRTETPEIPWFSIPNSCMY